METKDDGDNHVHVWNIAGQQIVSSAAVDVSGRPGHSHYINDVFSSFDPAGSTHTAEGMESGPPLYVPYVY